MERVKQLFAGMRARDVAFMGGYALYLAFGYMSFESPTVLTSLGEAGHLVQSVFLIAVIVARFAVYGTMVMLARRTGRLASMAAFVVTAATAAVGFVVTRMAFQFAGFVPLGSLVPYLVFGGVCFGAGDALINLMWARFSGTLGLRKVYVFVLMSNMLSLVVYFLVTLAPTSFMLPLGADVYKRQSLLCILRRKGDRHAYGHDVRLAGEPRQPGARSELRSDPRPVLCRQQLRQPLRIPVHDVHFGREPGLRADSGIPGGEVCGRTVTAGVCSMPPPSLSLRGARMVCEGSGHGREWPDHGRRGRLWTKSLPFRRFCSLWSLSRCV